MRRINKALPDRGYSREHLREYLREFPNAEMTRRDDSPPKEGPKKGGERRDSNRSEGRRAATRAVQAGEHRPPPYSPAVAPIYQTAPFFFDSAAELTEGFERPDQTGLYTRYANPTVRVVEDRLAALEGADEGVAFASGMAAISATLSTLVGEGDKLLAAADLYGGTSGWLKWLAQRFPSLEIETVSLDEIAERVEAGFDDRTRAVYLETPTNPLLRCCDLPRVGAACRTAGMPLVVDNTFATPVLQQPLKYGATHVVHSATKYLGGHSDVTAGVVAGSTEAITPIRRLQRLSGGCLDPHAAFLLARGMQTLVLRVERQSDNAAQLAQALRGHSAVESVYYPDDEVARRQMKRGGGMLSFDVAGGLEAAHRVLDRLRLFRLMASLGGVESSAVLAAATSHKMLTPSQREALGIRDGLVRLSVGIEDADDLEADLNQALAAA